MQARALLTLENRSSEELLFKLTAHVCEGCGTLAALKMPWSLPRRKLSPKTILSVNWVRLQARLAMIVTMWTCIRDVLTNVIHQPIVKSWRNLHGVTSKQLRPCKVCISEAWKTALWSLGFRRNCDELNLETWVSELFCFVTQDNPVNLKSQKVVPDSSLWGPFWKF